MASPRELAEQAFSLLQNAFRASEARASELDEQLKRKRAPKTNPEEQLDVLAHRLEAVEKERTRWQQQAAHLEEVAETERTKVAQLRKKLEVAESGPEKLTKKEVNFWRAKAEAFTGETQEYRDRIATLRREIIERDALIEKLRDGQLADGAAASTSPAESFGTPSESQPLARAEIDDLRAQLAERDRRVGTLEAQLAAVRETRYAAPSDQSLEIQARMETLSRQVATFDKALNEAHTGRAALKSELAAAVAELEHAQRAAREAQAAAERARTMVEEREHRIVELSAEIESVKQRAAAAASQSARAAIADREAQIHALRGQIEGHDREIKDRARRISELEQELAGHDERLSERNRALASLTEELEQARAMLEARDRELEQLRHHKQQLDGTLADALARADDFAVQLERAREEIRELAEHRAQLERQRDEVGEQVAGLEVELKEEKENAENLGEIANERREHMTKLQEKVDEAEERYEEAKYRLGKAAHFERLVKRRKGLIGKLLEAFRQKQKANTALKAGLDGLRTFKAGAEMNQQKLLQRIDALKQNLQEAQETIARHHGSTNTKEQLVTSETKVDSLEARLNAQAEVIETLEADLKTARAIVRTSDEKNHEIERLHKELEIKNKALAQLEADSDDQQRKLLKLRGTESETVRLRALTEKDRTEIETLEREVAQLRETLEKQGAGAAAPRAELETKLREREQSVTRLVGTIKEHEATIKKLGDTAESWKRKYQFLASDSPDAYKTAAEK